MLDFISSKPFIRQSGQLIARLPVWFSKEYNAIVPSCDKFSTNRTVPHFSYGININCTVTGQLHPYTLCVNSTMLPRERIKTMSKICRDVSIDRWECNFLKSSISEDNYD